MNEHPHSAESGICLTVIGATALPAGNPRDADTLLLRFKLENPAGHSRLLTIIADASDARGSFVASAACSLLLGHHGTAEAQLRLEAPPSCTILMSVRENGHILHTEQIRTPVIPFKPEKEESL